MTKTVQTAKQFAQNISKFNQRRFPNIITGDETRVYYLEPVKNLGNKILQSQHGSCQENHKNKVLYLSSHVMV